jgi:3-phenylpropionate/trans-cinnamate dioxygenase ferredoxin reductase subunit
MGGIVIIGAGQAGAALAAKLRALGHPGAITVIGDETAPPYQRPPLSKKYLLGEMPLERLFLRPESFYAEQDITLRLGERVLSVDPAAHQVVTSAGTLDYAQLVLATGAAPRRLPAAIGGALPGVHVVRNLADIDAMADEFAPGRRVVIVGGGYIGLEAAAVARQRGLDVTLIEAAARILQRVAAPETSDYMRALHRGQGVEIIEGAALDRLTGDSRVTGARLSDGREIAADFVIVGIGVVPSLPDVPGLRTEGAVLVDAQGRTNLPDIWAAGDCTVFPWRGQPTRLESVQNAIDQAETLAANIIGADVAYDPQPWFWSDQYDLKLQIAGLNRGYDRVVVRDSGAARSHWYFAHGTFIAVDALNDPRAFMLGKRLLAAGLSPDPAALADPAVDLKTLVG